MWESCMTFNEAWGYTPIDKNYKSAWSVLGMLRQVASGNGNLLLNIGPTPEGDVPAPCEKALKQVGRWMKKYGTSIYDATDRWKMVTRTVGWGWNSQPACEFTLKGSKIYVHINRWTGSTLAIGALENKVLSAKMMGGPAIAFTQSGGRLLLQGLPEEAPDPLATVIELVVEGEPTHSRSIGYGVPKEDPGPLAWE